MKKIFSIIIVIILVLVVFYGIKADIQNIKNKVLNEEKFLKVYGNKLVNGKGEEIQLRGVSTHGIQWFNDLYTYDNIKKLRDTWGINVFRIAMYTEPENNGYIKNNNLKNDVIKIVDDVINLDMYVIIDWHILLDGNPTKYEYEAIEFFDEMSLKYKDVPNVIFEICNEPNGNVSWTKDIKKYAENVIKVIRKNSPKSLIIVGTPEWCKDLSDVLKSPLDYDNILYSVHFYAGADGKRLKNNMDKFLNSDLPIFVSECGITDNTGEGEIYVNQFEEWINYINEKNLSWIFWSFSNKDESSSLLQKEYVSTDYSDDGEELDFNEYLSETGKIIKGIFDKYKIKDE